MAIDFTKKYRSTETYTAERFNTMGQDLVRVKNEYGMASAILSEIDFSKQYEQVPIAIL